MLLLVARTVTIWVLIRAGTREHHTWTTEEAVTVALSSAPNIIIGVAFITGALWPYPGVFWVAGALLLVVVLGRWRLGRHRTETLRR